MLATEGHQVRQPGHGAIGLGQLAQHPVRLETGQLHLEEGHARSGVAVAKFYRPGRWSDAQLTEQIRRGVETLSDILGQPVNCSASAGWRADERVIEVKERFGFRYNSDCRGQSLFRPRLTDGKPGTPQIPVDLPTFDEVVGPTVAAEGFNAFILDRFTAGNLNVYTIHAEVEGLVMADDFRQLLTAARQRRIQFCPLGDLLPANPGTLPAGRVLRGVLAGREGWLGVQGA